MLAIYALFTIVYERFLILHIRRIIAEDMMEAYTLCSLEDTKQLSA
jgi:hypothetical protein